MDKKWVYSFNANETEGNKGMKNLLGGKGANLAEMASLGLAVPPGLTVSTEACFDYYKQDKSISKEIKEQVQNSINNIEKLTNKKFGDSSNPLLFSVRSGAAVSMPGMMDTVLNLGLNDETVAGLAKLTGNERFAWDSYRRFIQMYADVVLGVNVSLLESTLEDLKDARGAESDTDLTAEDLKELVAVYKNILMGDLGVSFPLDAYEQLWKAIGAVFGSWENGRAIRYREINNIPHDIGTAVNVQSMVFGNMGNTSGTGVCFTRDPSTGDKRFFGEYLLNAQGEDVVAGIRTPLPVNEESRIGDMKGLSLEKEMPEVYNELVETYKKLEDHYKDMQDIEFTIENKKLYLLQTRNGKRTTAAALKIAVDLVSEGMIDEKTAVMRILPEDLNQLLHPRLDPKAKKDVLAKGLPASPGAACGKVVFSSEKAASLGDAGKRVLLVRQETSPEDISGMVAAQGILTARGGMTSHAAVVARGMGKPCVAGCSSLIIDEKNKTLTVGNDTFGENDYITLDGATGEVIRGEVPTIDADISGDFGTFMSWADKFRKLGVRANADNPEDAQVALDFGAEGIGLCRTEHMFFDPERILAVREMIFAGNNQERSRALEKILPFQKQDFVGLFKSMCGKPVNIRLLDPPLHEFLPHSETEMKELADALGKELKEVTERGAVLSEFNPMLGHRGCRLGITFPEIYLMQATAIVSAAIESKKAGIEVYPEIMIPLIATAKELELLRFEVEEERDRLLKEAGVEMKIKIGTMIELPRAAITADEIAPHADFFSFGTNDLTQTTFGLSRDDSGKFLPDYIGRGVFEKDPFVALDQKGVGFLVELAAKKGRETNKDIHLGICGEHGGEPSSVAFCHKIGLDYVSCSPYRVPIARLSAAQAAIEE